MQDARVAMRSDLESEHKLTLDPCRARIEECLNTTPEGAERPDRRSEVLNEAVAQEVERKVRRREEIGSTAAALAVPQELKDMPIPPDSDRRERRTTKAQRQLADGRQPCSCRDADTAKFDGSRVKNGRRGRRERRIQMFESTKKYTNGGVTNGCRRRRGR